MSVRIIWDPAKAAENLKKHGVSFDEATEVFDDPFIDTVDDDIHSHEEDRFAAIGAMASGRLLFISYTIRGADIRLISARDATRSEKSEYMDKESTINDAPMEPGDEETRHLDWSKAVRGLHYIPRVKGSAILDEDVYVVFRTSEEVNNALRMLIREGRIPHFVSDEEWYAEGKRLREQSASPPARPARRGGARRR